MSRYKTALTVAVVAATIVLAAPRADAALVGYWAFDEGTGQFVADSSGNGNIGTLGADADAGTDDPTWITGHTGNVGDFALNFDDSTTVKDDVVRIADPGTSSLDLGSAAGTSDAMSSSVWVNRNVSSGTDVIFVKGPTGGSGTNFPGNYSLLITSGGALQFIWQRSTATGSLSNVTTGTGAVTADDGWTHIAFTLQESTDGVTGTFYVNGTVVASTPTNANTANFGAINDQPLLIGNRADLNPPFGGGIDDLALWDHVLTASEIDRLADGVSPLVIPEPASAALVLIGAVLLAGPRRRARIR